MQKTNAMRMLDRSKIAYEVFEFDPEEPLNATQMAAITGLSAEAMFKTLVLQGDQHDFLVCCIAMDEELDMKKVAKASNHKRVEMLPLKQLFATTGYVRKGCSPIGMKKVFNTYIDETVLLFDEICVNGGMRGTLLKISSKKLIEFCSANVVELCK